MRIYRDNNIWSVEQKSALRNQVEEFFVQLQLAPENRTSTKRGSYVGKAVKEKIGSPEFQEFVENLAEAGIFYETAVWRMPRYKRGQIPDINTKILLKEIQLLTSQLLNSQVGLYQMDPAISHITRTESFVIDVARHLGTCMKLKLPKNLNHILPSARKVIFLKPDDYQITLLPQESSNRYRANAKNSISGN